MNQSTKRNFALFLVLVMCITFLPVFQLNANATVENETVTYRYDGNYVYNWGSREEVATFLSPMAEAFYTSNGVSYDQLADLTGGTSQTNVPSSELYDALQELIKKAHKHETSYQETRPLYKYTDCQNNEDIISSFYSGKEIGPAWDSGATWNREHTWPNSKGLNGNDENDIMMLRPTSVSENSSRGNKAYGKSDGYYNPNKESGGTHDVRGDVARIFLYIYVRWENTGKAWGTSGVMESAEVLLEWMEIDPVDTWEMGRNDAVQSITGTRNVFVDYPELAYLLFSEEIPSDMETPSGMAKWKCEHIYDNDCDTECNECGFVRIVANHIYDNDCDINCNYCGFIRVVGNHVYDYYCDDTCNICGETRTSTHIYVGWKIIEEATVDAPGIEQGRCLYCGGTTDREIPKLAPPIVEEPNNPPAEDTPSDKEPPEDNECEHTFGDWENGENGEKIHTCTKCGKGETMPIENGNGEQGSSAPDEPLGFFGKIIQFFKNLFKKIASIFK